MANEFKKECGVGMYWCNTDQKCKPMQEDGPVIVPANSVGTGAVAGVGVGSQGEPGVNKKKGLTPFISFIRRKKPQ
jgi:hypothetical protein